jgi:lycopene beta-cyclase
MSLPPPSFTHYDFILAGGGLAGLSAVTEMVQHSAFREKRFLIIDKADKQGNDRTWCFWESKADRADKLAPVTSFSWPRMVFQAPSVGKILLQTTDYQYVMVRSSAFYAWAYQSLQMYPNVHRLQASIKKIDSENGIVSTDVGEFQASWILNSAFQQFQLESKYNARVGWDGVFAEGENMKCQTGVTSLQQHFLGWYVQVEVPVFQTDEITLMDYHTPHQGDTRFVYVLPLSNNEALVEYTVFSADLLESRAAYEAALRAYIVGQLHIENFEITETEFGVIPMSDFRSVHKPEGRVLHIGTVGGTVKASSGYGFKSTRSRMKKFVADWAVMGKPNVSLLQSNRKFRLYDGALLRVLERQWLTGEQVFSAMFSKLPATLIFKFLDEKTHLWDEIRVMLSVPMVPFLKAVWQKIWKI